MRTETRTKNSGKRGHKGNPRRRGAIMVFVMLMLPVLFILVAFALNLTYGELARTELITSADAAARAGGRTFVVTRDQALGAAAATDAASRNMVAGTPLQLLASDIVYGQATRSVFEERYLFTPGLNPANSLQVTGRRDSTSPDGPIPLLFPFMLNGSISAQHQAVSTQVEVDIALVLDRSGSMAYAANEPVSWPTLPAAAPPGWAPCDEVPTPSRWRDLLLAVQAFSTELNASPQGEAVGLVTYSASATTNLALTTNYASIDTALDAYTQNFCFGMTNVGDGIIHGINLVGGGRPWAVKVIIVMTDGNHNTGTNPVTAAQMASSQGITIYTVTFSDEANQALMSQVAEEAFGQNFHADNAANLQQAFRDIANSLPMLLTR